MEKESLTPEHLIDIRRLIREAFRKEILNADNELEINIKPSKAEAKDESKKFNNP